MTKDQGIISPITTKAQIVVINKWPIAHLPKSASIQLPSRGQVMAEANVNGVRFQTPLEPDGNGSHWFELSDDLRHKISASPGKSIEISIQPSKDWPEPAIPVDIQEALAAHPKAYELWQRITPMARWEWIRWSRATSNSETRKRRIEVGMSKLEKGERRPCCWNRNLCTVPEVSRNGVLLQNAG